MSNTEQLAAIRNLANEILGLIDSKPISPLMPWMIESTPEEHAATIASHCAKLAAEIVSMVIDRPTTIDPA